MTAHCHKHVKGVAMAAAGELYEQMMGNDSLFKIWKEQNPGASAKELERRFIEKNWGKCVEFARRTMTLLLTQPDVPERVKMEILDALEKDQSLVRGRNRVMH